MNYLKLLRSCKALNSWDFTLKNLKFGPVYKTNLVQTKSLSDHGPDQIWLYWIPVWSGPNPYRTTVRTKESGTWSCAKTMVRYNLVRYQIRICKRSLHIGSDEMLHFKTCIKLFACELINHYNQSVVWPKDLWSILFIKLIDKLTICWLSPRLFYRLIAQ